MNIKFRGQKLSTLEWVESDSILQGRHSESIRIFLKTSEKFPQWAECIPDTVIQIDSFSKLDLEKAWNHGAIRAPMKYQHLNNFNEYYKLKYEDKSYKQ